MKIKDLREYIPINADDIEVNPTTEIENHFFSSDHTKDYREEAIAFSVKHKLPVSTTLNNSYELIKRLIKFSCPQCHHAMELGTGCGNGCEESVEFHCAECNVTAHLTIPIPNGISFGFG